MTASRVIQSPLDRANGYEVVWDQVSEVFGAGKPFVDATFVYVIGEENAGPVKIGLAKDPIQRLRGMQTGNPRRLRVEYVLLGGIRVEKLLHDLWAAFAISSAMNSGKPDAAPGTEWFREEIRFGLFPIMATAAERQVDYVWEARDDVTMDGLEQVVRDAHKEHDHVAQGRDEIRLLGAVTGYAINRPSRI